MHFSQIKIYLVDKHLRKNNTSYQIEGLEITAESMQRQYFQTPPSEATSNTPKLR